MVVHDTSRRCTQELLLKFRHVKMPISSALFLKTEFVSNVSFHITVKAAQRENKNRVVNCDSVV
jgi:hypothetical protein